MSTLSGSSSTEQLIAKLYPIDDKTEIIEREIVMMRPRVATHGCASGAIFASLRSYEKNVGDRTRPPYHLPQRRAG